MKFKDEIVLQGCREEYCEYGPATGILCWVYDVIGESYLTCLCGLMIFSIKHFLFQIFK